MWDDLLRRGWPALSEVDIDGWVARQSGGVTQRANSVLPLAAPADPQAALAEVERHYAAHGLPAIFQVGPAACPPDLDDLLAARGYALRLADLGRGGSGARAARRAAARATW